MNRHPSTHELVVTDCPVIVCARVCDGGLVTSLTWSEYEPKLPGRGSAKVCATCKVRLLSGADNTFHVESHLLRDSIQKPRNANTHVLAQTSRSLCHCADRQETNRQTSNKAVSHHEQTKALHRPFQNRDNFAIRNRQKTGHISPLVPLCSDRDAGARHRIRQNSECRRQT